MVSIIIRTHNRPLALREALLGLRNQTYRNFEICIVEDGEDHCSEIIKREFGDLNINYKATGKSVGRCEAANLGMKMSKGKYLNFLDDDDLLMAGHIEALVSELEDNEEYVAAFARCMEERREIVDEEKYKYRIVGRLEFPCNYSCQMDIFRQNCFPIQSVMFRKSVLKKMTEGGKFDTKLDKLEDWDFWIRMGLVGGFHGIEKGTSLFRTPADLEEFHLREKDFAGYGKIIRRKYQNQELPVTVGWLMLDQ